MKGEEEKKAVFLPAVLYGRIEEREHATEFSSVADYVTYVMEEILREEEIKSVWLFGVSANGQC